jgi:hypothetical protein
MRSSSIKISGDKQMMLRGDHVSVVEEEISSLLRYVTWFEL